ncbi:DUF5115 domain-containing protein [Prevotella sp. kh1p2]|uniref:Outer membrane protein SusF domain-containing protein n=1 Tax=Prevotella sp. kh1p2 TaxID=1761883 RepID=UPI0008AC491E|nr:DUF5115 domain-containing protein [Prevotella sp. kh1p2]SES93116.1 protein of unknown function [Prevotella sp. kh1p2]SNU11215.1 protein of unknown function [Prevotellaceae bacterium KH2P17]
MKKISLYLSLALAGLFMGSCSDDYTDWADPQSYAPEDAVTLPGFTATAADAIDLNQDADSVKTFTLSTAALPEGYELANARIELTPEGVDNATTTTLNTTLAGLTNAAELQELIAAAYGVRPTNRVLNAHVYVSAVRNGQAALIDAGTLQVNVTPKAPVIEQAYYLTGSLTGWDNGNKTIKFANGGGDVYADPIFVAVFDAPAGGSDIEFKLTPESKIGTDDWNSCLAAGDEGKFNYNNVGKNFKITAVPGAVKYRVTFNMLEQTWSYEGLNFAEFIYETGNNTGWGDGLSLYGPNFDGKYYAALYLQSGVKFRSNLSDWNGEWNLGQDGGNPQEGVLINSGSSSDIKLTADGFYNVEVDVANLTYKFTPFTSIDIIGDGQPGGWNSGTVMTYDTASRTWTAKGVTLTDGSIKFRSDQSWSNVNLGGSLAKLVQGSNDNIPVSAGKYDIVLHLENTAARAPYAELKPVP